MAGNVLNIKIYSPLKLCIGLTGNYHATYHYSYNLSLTAIRTKQRILNMKNKFLLILYTLILVGCNDSTQKKLPNGIEKETQQRIELGYHLGTVIGIIDKDGTRYYSFGQKSLTDVSKPDYNSIFEIGSVTKTFTSSLLSDLNEKNEINIKDSIQTYLPVFKNVMAKNNKIITLENLSTHTSGLPRDPFNMDVNSDYRYRDYSTAKLNDFLSNYTLDTIPNTYNYSNLGILIIELAIESKMNKTYESLIKDRIANVLNMSDTEFKVSNDKRPRLVTGFRNGKETDELDLGEFQAMGGLRSTAKDMLKFLGAQLDMYPSSLSDALKKTHSIHYKDNNNVMGLGWEILESKESGKTIYYHKGGTPGFVSFVGFNLEDKIGVVVLINGSRYFSDLGFKLLDQTYPLSKAE